MPTTRSEAFPVEGNDPKSNIDRYEKWGKKSAFGKPHSGSLGAADIVPAMEALRRTFASEHTFSKEWRVGQLHALRRLLREGNQELCDAMYEDLHKSAFEAYSTEMGLVEKEIETALSHLGEWMAPHYTDTAALNTAARSYTVHDPLGVVLIMGPWNYPVQMCFAPLVGAIAGGNCALLKPGSYAPATSHVISRLVQQYLDPAAIVVAEGDREVTTALLDQRFDKIFFTGSGFVGKIILQAAAKHFTPCLLELGGKSPAIVDRSADLGHAARRLVWGTFINGGQTCIRPDFLLVHEAVAEPFLKLLKATIKEFYGADPQKSEWFGRCVNERAFKRLEAIVRGAPPSVVYSGGRTDAAERYIEPTVLDYGGDWRAFSSCEAMQDELFGPILPVCRYSDLEAVVSFVKALPTGKPLALYCFATDSAVVEDVKRRTTSGGLCINDCVMHIANHDLPFGGVGASGMGSYHAHRSFLAFTHEKAVLSRSPAVDEYTVLKPLLAARFPPYAPHKQFLVKLFGMWTFDKAVNVHRSPAVAVALLAYLAYYVATAYFGMRLAVTFE